MGIAVIDRFVENNKVAKCIRRALSSYFFPVVTALVAIAGYYLGWEIVTIWYLCLTGTAIMVFCKDVSPVLSLFLFMNILISVKHCPSNMGAGSDYLFRPEILSQIVVGVVIFLCALVWRTVVAVKEGRFKLTPVFWGLVAFCVAMCLSGVFYSAYTAINLLYGLAFSALLLGIFVFACGNIKIEQETFVKIAYYFVVLFAAVALELLIAYCTIDGLIVDGKVDRSKLFMGWGTYNLMGMLLTVTVPAWFYLAGKNRFGFLFLIGSILNLAASFLCMSRQAILMSTVIFAACCVWLLIWDKGKRRIINVSIMAGILAVAAIVLGIMHESVAEFFSSLAISLKTGSGRTLLWKGAMMNFFSKPLFGVGFYNPLAEKEAVGYFGSGAIMFPTMAHNTVIQLLCSCGLVGLMSYVVHRAHTIISYINNPTHERTFIALTACALLLVSLLDNDIFYFLPTIFYAVLVALLVITEKKSGRTCTVGV